MAARVAVVGHVEWVTHARGEVPPVGEIVHLADAFDEPAGGGAVAAFQIARLAGRCDLFTALGDGPPAERIAETLGALDVRVHAAGRRGPQPRALSVSGASGERTIFVHGGRMAPTLDDDLPWDELARCDAVYFTGDDPRTLIAARSARHLVVAARRLQVLIASGVVADVVVASANDPAEVVDMSSLPVPPRALVRTDGARGGTIVTAEGEVRYLPAAAAGPVVDAYGAGDSFAGGLTYGLGTGFRLDEAAALGARCGAAALATRGGLSHGAPGG